MLPGAFEHAAGGMHTLQLDPVNTAAGQRRGSREMWTQEQITSLQMLPTHRERDGNVLGLNVFCVIIQEDTEKGR